MRKEAGDDGFTLVDTLMSTVLMTVVMAIFTSSIIAMYKTANSVDRASVAQTQISVAMQRLDREVRYAMGISSPYNSGKYIDFLTVRPGKQTCVQLRLVNGVLSRRSWTYQASPIDLSSWSAVASDVTATTPFTYVAPSDTLGFQQLKVQMVVGSGTDQEINSATFTALNSSRSTSNNYCSAGRSL